MSFSDHRMCIPGDNRVNVLGLYSVQMRGRQMHSERQEQFHHSPLERVRECVLYWGEGGGRGAS